MDTPNSSYQFGSLNRSNHDILPVSAFSAYNLLRNHNYFLTPRSQDAHLKALHEVPTESSRLPPTNDIQLSSLNDSETPCLDLTTKTLFSPSTMSPYSHPLHFLNDQTGARISTSGVSPTLNSFNFRKQRSEKKPIPNEKKDDKYFERRRRNNQAAKKSRDARKMREDQVALKATILEHENAILRAQVLTLREEASSLRQMLLQRKAFELPSQDF